MASCSYSFLLNVDQARQTSRGFSVCYTLQDCNKNVASHPRSCKVVDDRVEKEFQLLLARGRCCLKRYSLTAFISLSVFDSEHVGKRFQTVLCSIKDVHVNPSNAVCSLRMCLVLDARNPQRNIFSNKYLLADEGAQV